MSQNITLTDLLSALRADHPASNRQFLRTSAGAGGRRRRKPRYEHARRHAQTPPTRRDDGPNLADYLSPLRAA